MKKLLIGLVMVLMGLLLMVPIASAYPVAEGDTIIATLGIGGGLNGGGAFNIDKFGDDQGVLFDTFCMERAEHFTPGEKLYIGSITDFAIRGGEAVSDPLDSESAYLMYQWATGAIPHTALDANAVQIAIWAIEDAWLVALVPGGLAETYYNEALANNDGSLYGVQVMNLYGAPPVTGAAPIYKQDMLVYNLVPEPATLLLFGLGLLGLAGLRRNLKK